MLLRQLFIKISPKYEGDGMRKADKEIDKVDDGVKKLNKTLNILTAAMSAAGLAGLHAFTGWDRALSSLAVKAGMTRKEFEKMYGSASGAIARATGANRLIIAEALQKTHSLGVTGDTAIDLAKLAAVLQREGAADMRTAMEASVALSKQKLGSPLQLLEQITKGAQIGSGDMPDYFQALKGIGGLGGNLQVSSAELVSAITVMSASAKSMREGETQVRSMLASVMKPTSESQKLMESRTGKTTEDIQKIMAGENGLIKYLEMIRDNFDPKEFIKITGTQEGTLAMTALINDISTLTDNAQQIINSKGIVDAIDKDSGSDFSTAVDRFREAIKSFMQAYGKPLAQMLKPFIVATSALISGVLALNESMGGLLMWIPALITSLLGLRLALIGARRVGGFIAPWLRGGGAAGADGRDGGKGRAGGGIGLSDIAKIAASVFTGLYAGRYASRLYQAVKRGWAYSGRDNLAKGFKFGGRNAFLNTFFMRASQVLRFFTTALGGATLAVTGLAAAAGMTKRGQAQMSKWDDPAIDDKQKAILSAEWIRLKAIWNGINQALFDGLSWLNMKFHNLLSYITGIDLTGIVDMDVKFTNAIKDFVGAITDFLASVWWVITNPIDAIMRGIRYMVADAMSLVSQMLDDIPGIGTPEIEAAEAQVDAVRNGKQVMFKDGNLFVDGQQIGTTTLPTPSIGGTQAGAKGDVTITNNVDVDATGADDPQAVGDAVRDALYPNSLKEWDAERINQNSQSFQFGG